MEVQKTMEKIFEKNNDWIDICKSFGLDEPTAQDLVQEMYIKIQLKLEDGLDISYGKTDVNTFYIFKTLRNLFYDLKRKGKNIIRVGTETLRAKEGDVDYSAKYKLVQDELEKMYWYDRKVFDIINSGESIAELSRKSGIQYYSLYNTYRKVKARLLKLL
jgi:Glu-tRNA(Gln) amidotransferase subunit E-like FAD-binding protein